MPLRPRPVVRRCPICGRAMQASKSRETLRDVDTFSCLNCDTTIVEAKLPRAGAAGKG